MIPFRGPAARAAAIVTAGLLAVLPALPFGALGAQEPDSTAAESSAPPQPAILVGQVVSEVTGEPLAGATVALRVARRGAVTDSAGNFHVPQAIAGDDTLEVRYVGYEGGSTPITLEPEVTTRVVLLLAPNVLRVAELEVEIERGEFRLGLREFERRRAKGIGEFVTREQIERLDPRRTSDVLRRIPGLRVGPGDAGRRTDITLSRDAFPCHPAVFVDGLAMANFSVDDINVPELGAIEVYTAAGQIPAQYGSMAPSACGAILIWTRRGKRPGDPS